MYCRGLCAWVVTRISHSSCMCTCVDCCYVKWVLIVSSLLPFFPLPAFRVKISILFLKLCTKISPLEKNEDLYLDMAMKVYETLWFISHQKWFARTKVKFDFLSVWFSKSLYSLNILNLMIYNFVLRPVCFGYCEVFINQFTFVCKIWLSANIAFLYLV